MKKALFAAGCFWGVEATFRKIKGVENVISGYSGGDVKTPTYKQVCTGKTGHAETVEIHYDEAMVSYSELLETFWQCHNPTELNRQGPDVGTQYRSAIFYQNDHECEIAEQSKTQAQSRFSTPIVTEINPAKTFYPAEDYHQNYLARNNQTCMHRF